MYNDRNDAAAQLAEHLDKYKDDNCIVLAIPRGGVPIGHQIATALNCKLEVLLAKKIGHPDNKEFAIGSVSLIGNMVEHDGENADKEYLRSESKRILKELEEQHHAYTGNGKTPDLKDKVVIIIDDGAATGKTISAAAKSIRSKDPAKLVIAVPVCSHQAAHELTQAADEFICPLVPDNFSSVGEFYRDFTQVDDAEVTRLLHAK